MELGTASVGRIYELEYLHVDDYKADGTRRRTTLRYNFRTDAVRE